MIEKAKPIVSIICRLVNRRIRRAFRDIYRELSPEFTLVSKFRESIVVSKVEVFTLADRDSVHVNGCPVFQFRHVHHVENASAVGVQSQVVIVLSIGRAASQILVHIPHALLHERLACLAYAYLEEAELSQWWSRWKFVISLRGVTPQSESKIGSESNLLWRQWRVCYATCSESLLPSLNFALDIQVVSVWAGMPASNSIFDLAISYQLLAAYRSTHETSCCSRTKPFRVSPTGRLI